MAGEKPKKPRASRVEIKLPDHLAGGVYANNMVVSHTREEFVLDFLAVFHPRAGVVSARVVLSPGHLKRVVRALTENLSRYEARFGELIEAASPEDGKVQ
ncbi:MAG: DUF3467 domain-containing protein [Acidobacteriota bacterium]